MIRKLNRVNYHSLPYLSEATRKDLITKSLKQSPERVARSKEYKITGKINIDVDNLLFKDQLIVTVPVNQYICTIELTNVIETIAKVVDKQHRGNVNLDSVRKALRVAMDNEENLLVNCTCPDFYYRFSYVATKNGYKNGKRQLISAPIRNPRDDKGSFCKHLIMILKNKDWIQMLASVVNYFIKEYYYDILQIYSLDATHFYINQSGVHNDKVNGIRPQPKRSKRDMYTPDEDEDFDDGEELELRVD